MGQSHEGGGVHLSFIINFAWSSQLSIKYNSVISINIGTLKKELWTGQELPKFDWNDELVLTRRSNVKMNNMAKKIIMQTIEIKNNICYITCRNPNFLNSLSFKYKMAYGTMSLILPFSARYKPSWEKNKNIIIKQQAWVHTPYITVSK